MTETEIKSLADAHEHSQELAAQHARADLPPPWAKVAKRITWMILLAGAFLAYYLLDKMQEALSLLK